MPREGGLLLAAAALGACALACAGPAPRIWWGDLHGHTAASDGQGSFADYYRHARDVAALDFVAVSDHDFGNGPPWQMPDATWEELVRTAAEFSEDGVFVALPGFEWTSQPKYWTELVGAPPAAPRLAGAPHAYGHKVVCYPPGAGELLPAHAAATCAPESLAARVAALGGVIHTAHPDAADAETWGYDPRWDAVIANAEIGPDRLRYGGVDYAPMTERTVFDALRAGRRLGLVAGSDTHEGRPGPRTAVWAARLDPASILAALRARRCYATTGARIDLDLRVAGVPMGGEAIVAGAPRIQARVRGTAPLRRVEILRDGAPLRVLEDLGTATATLDFHDEGFAGSAWYLLRVTQDDAGEHGNPSRAWSSPVWCRAAAASAAAAQSAARAQAAAISATRSADSAAPAKTKR